MFERHFYTIYYNFVDNFIKVLCFHLTLLLLIFIQIVIVIGILFNNHLRFLLTGIFSICAFDISFMTKYLNLGLSFVVNNA
jgi:hypothetical protein